jgi:hypothetical protein
MTLDEWAGHEEPLHVNRHGGRRGEGHQQESQSQFESNACPHCGPKVPSVEVHRDDVNRHRDEEHHEQRSVPEVP